MEELFKRTFGDSDNKGLQRKLESLEVIDKCDVMGSRQNEVEDRINLVIRYVCIVERPWRDKDGETTSAVGIGIDLQIIDTELN